MKKGVLVGIAALLLCCSACSESSLRNIEDNVNSFMQQDDKHVLLVKNSYPLSYPGCTYGKVYGEFFSNPTWRYFEGTDSEGNTSDVVEFTGNCIYMDKEVKARQQFILDMDHETFQQGALSFNDVPQNRLTELALFEKVFSEYAEKHGTQEADGALAQENPQEGEEDFFFGDGEEGNEDDIEYDSASNEYILPGSDTRYLSDEEIDALSQEELRLAINEIYARHGRRFNAADLQSYFDARSWYHGTVAPEDFDEGVLNAYEKKNVSALASRQDGSSSSQIGSTAADPLNGLVAEDILVKFRNNYSVGTYVDLGDAVYDEAMVLGNWIKQNYGGYFSDDIYSQATSIGNRYEWFFGTDISNNFENNFAYIYAVYFGLKNYYTNGGSAAVYGMLASDYADFYFYDGAEAAIQQMYGDLQGFVTSCNDVVRMYG